jgi:hypothetical protein
MSLLDRLIAERLCEERLASAWRAEPSKTRRRKETSEKLRRLIPRARPPVQSSEGAPRSQGRSRRHSGADPLRRTPGSVETAAWLPGQPRACLRPGSGPEAQPPGEPPLAVACVPRLPRSVPRPPRSRAVHHATPFFLVFGPGRCARGEPTSAGNSSQGASDSAGTVSNNDMDIAPSLRGLLRSCDAAAAMIVEPRRSLTTASVRG